MAEFIIFQTKCVMRKTASIALFGNVCLNVKMWRWERISFGKLLCICIVRWNLFYFNLRCAQTLLMHILASWVCNLLRFISQTLLVRKYSVCERACLYKNDGKVIQTTCCLLFIWVLLIFRRIQSKVKGK